MIRYHARWLVPVSEPPIEHGTVVVDGRRIAYVGPRAAAPAGRDHELGDALLLPGLVNAHCQLELTAARGLLGGLPDHERLPLLSRATHAALSEDAMLDGARAAVAEGLRAGVTTFADFGASSAGVRAMSELGVRGVAFQEVVGPTPSERADALTAVQRRLDRLRPFESPLLRLGVAPHSVYAVHEDLLVDACALAIAERLPIAIRAAESDAEIAFIREGEGPYAERLRALGVEVVRRSYSPVHLLKELGVADVASPLLVGAVRFDGSDVAFVAGTGCTVVHCPSDSARRGDGVAPLAELLAAGVAVGLGSGSGASGDPVDLLGEARLAATLQALRAGRPDTLSPTVALELVTIGGARALRLDDRVGTLEVGKDADLAAFPLDGVHASLVHDPTVAALHALTGAVASFVAVAGEPRVSAGRLVTPLDAALPARLQSSADALALWLSRASNP